MKSVISNLNQINNVRHAQSSNAHALIVPRKRLLSALLANRAAIRVICAPPKHGKTVLARLYSEEVFDADRLHWIDASEPSFLVTLDAVEAGIDFLDIPEASSQKKDSMLYVIDACPSLDQTRFSTLLKIAEELVLRSHEIIITTQDVRWYSCAPHHASVMSAKDLLFDIEEQAFWINEQSDQNAERTFEALYFDVAIPGVYTKGEAAHSEFVSMLHNSRIETEDAALSLIALVFEKGSVNELRSFVPFLRDSTFAQLELRFPFCGVKRFEPMFNSLHLTDQEKFDLVCAHMNDLVSVLAFSNRESDLMDHLVEKLVKRGQVKLASMFVCGIQNDAKRCEFFDAHAQDMIFYGNIRTILRLSATVSENDVSKDLRWVSVAIALGILGRRKQAIAIAEKFLSSEKEHSKQRSEEALNEVHFAAMLIRLFFESNRSFDLERFRNTVAGCFAGRTIGSSKQMVKRAFIEEIILLVCRTMEDPLLGYKTLENISSSGYTVKESLIATCIFVQLACRCCNPEQDRNIRLTSTQQDERSEQSSAWRATLGSLEEHIAYMLVRSCESLSANVAELFLFLKAKDLVGDRAFLLANDRTLSRVNKLQSALDAECLIQEESKIQNKAIIRSLSSNLERLNKPDKTLRINTFGRFEIKALDPNITVDSKMRKQLRLLVTLLVAQNRNEVARSWIQQILWPGYPEANAKQSLYSMWNSLRSSVTDQGGDCPFFESSGQSVCINYELVETDTGLLEDICKTIRTGSLLEQEYEMAIEEIECLYIGELLPGEDTPEIVAKRNRYQDYLIEALMVGCERLRKRGENNLALRYIKFAFSVSNTREDVCYLLMQLLRKQNRHGEALNAFYECQKSLNEKLGIEATARLKKLYEAILEEVS